MCTCGEMAKGGGTTDRQTLKKVGREVVKVRMGSRTKEKQEWNKKKQWTGKRRRKREKGRGEARDVEAYGSESNGERAVRHEEEYRS